MGTIDYDPVEVLTFDCYGTLIDWEAGIAAGLAAVTRAHGRDVPSEELLATYAGHEAELEAGPYRRYRDILAAACRGVCADLGIDADRRRGRDVRRLGRGLAGLPGLGRRARRAAARFRLAVITNCDDDLFAASNRRLGVTFDWIVTAEQAGSYKPSHRNFELAFERIGRPRDRILHVAQSLFHDHVPGRASSGSDSVWINRRGDRPGPRRDAARPRPAPDAT